MHSSAILAAAFVAIVAALPNEACHDGCQGQFDGGRRPNWQQGVGRQQAGQWQQTPQYRPQQQQSGYGQGVNNWQGTGQWQGNGQYRPQQQQQAPGYWQQQQTPGYGRQQQQAQGYGQQQQQAPGYRQQQQQPPRFDQQQQKSPGFGQQQQPPSGFDQQGGVRQQQQQQQQQLPLQFAGAGDQQVQIGQLTPCDYQTSSISFAPAATDVDVNIHVDFDMDSVTCQAFTDAEGNNQIGTSFGRDQSCDFDSPTQVRSILCTIN